MRSELGSQAFKELEAAWKEVEKAHKMYLDSKCEVVIRCEVLGCNFMHTVPRKDLDAATVNLRLHQLQAHGMDNPRVLLQMKMVS